MMAEHDTVPSVDLLEFVDLQLFQRRQYSIGPAEGHDWGSADGLISWIFDKIISF